MNPVESFWGWFEGLSDSERNNIKAMVMMSMPNVTQDRALDPDALCTAFDNYFKSKCILDAQEISKLLILRELINFYVYNNKDFSLKERVYKKLAKERPEYAAHHESVVAGIPAEKAAFELAKSKWETLCNSQLTYDELRRYLDEMFIKNHDEMEQERMKPIRIFGKQC